MTFKDFPPDFITRKFQDQVRFFHRVEPLPRTDDLTVSLRVEIADPLWMLARQRQFGELGAEDAGSPVEVRFTATSGRISRLHRGALGATPAAGATDIDGASTALEVAVEAEPRPASDAGAVVDLRLAAEAGLHFLRLLRAQGVGNLGDPYRRHYAFSAADVPVRDGSATLLDRIVGRVPDGRRLALDLAEFRDASGAVTSLPSAPPIAASDAAAVRIAAARFLTWWDALVPDPVDAVSDAWVPDQLEHRFALQADLPDGPVVLRADSYRGGHLDWYSFQAADGPNLGRSSVPRPAETVTRAMLPTPVAYAGMPADRFWAIEDGSVRFGGLDTGRTDLARLLLTEFALTYGNDWFVVPIDLPVGSVCRIERVEVLDTFGEATTIARSADSQWRVFELDAPAGPDRVSGLFFLAPTLASTQESAPVEEVAFARDELANMVWAIERRVQDAAGDPVERYQEHQQRLAEAQPVAADSGDADLVYRLATDVPYHWFPFVPVQTPGAPPSAGSVVLQRRTLARSLPDGTTDNPVPRGRILDLTRTQLREEEVLPQGTDVVRTHQLARWIDGRYHLWTGRKSRPGKGEASSGLRFDTTVPRS